MSAPEEKKTIYALYIIRKDIGPMSILEDDNYDKVYERWVELKENWTTAVKEKIPFEINKPIITVFDPGLVDEITLKPVVETTASRYQNPYHQDMVKNGLSNSLKPYHPDIKDDGGYR